MRLTQILGCTPSISLELICMQRAFIMPQCDDPFLTQSQLWRLRCEFFTIIMGHSMLILMHFCVMVWPPFFPFSSLSVPCPISITFRLHPPSSACLPPPLLQLWGVLVQLCYVHARTSLRLTSDLLRPDPHTKGYCLYTSYNLSDPSFIINNG